MRCSSWKTRESLEVTSDDPIYAYLGSLSLVAIFDIKRVRRIFHRSFSLWPGEKSFPLSIYFILFRSFVLFSLLLFLFILRFRSKFSHAENIRLIFCFSAFHASKGVFREIHSIIIFDSRGEIVRKSKNETNGTNVTRL